MKKSFYQTKTNLGMVLLLAIIFLFSFIGPFFLQDPLAQNLEKALQPPNQEFLWGSDELGRDLLARVALGGQLSLLVGIIATLVSLVIGVSYGVVSGYFGSKVDLIMMRIVDILYSLPYMFLVIILISILGKNIIALFIALGAVQWLTTARIVRAQVLTLKDSDFIKAAILAGSSAPFILIRHLIPNILPIVAVYATLTIPTVILQEAFLSFLGLNVSDCTWGLLASEGSSLLDVAWWMVLFPGLILTITLLCFNYVGDSLRDYYDPKT